MASGKSLSLEKSLLDSVLGGTAYTPPGTVYVALSTALYSTTATGASMSEVSTTSTAYARVAVTNNTTNWPAASGSVVPASKSNGTAITFPTATGAWGTVRAFYIVDASTSGNVLMGADLGTAKTPVSGDVCSFAIGALVWTES